MNAMTMKVLAAEIVELYEKMNVHGGVNDEKRIENRNNWRRF